MKSITLHTHSLFWKSTFIIYHKSDFAEHCTEAALDWWQLLCGRQDRSQIVLWQLFSSFPILRTHILIFGFEISLSQLIIKKGKRINLTASDLPGICRLKICSLECVFFKQALQFFVIWLIYLTRRMVCNGFSEGKNDCQVITFLKSSRWLIDWYVYWGKKINLGTSPTNQLQ